MGYKSTFLLYFKNCVNPKNFYCKPLTRKYWITIITLKTLSRPKNKSNKFGLFVAVEE